MQCPVDSCAGPQTQLKYAVEIVIPKSTRMLGIMEPVLERVVFEDMPANLVAIKRHVEAREVCCACFDVLNVLISVFFSSTQQARTNIIVQYIN